MAQRGRQEDGTVMVYVALLLVVLVGFVGLAVDGSHAYAQYRRMQTAADAAALAGVRVLALGESPVEVEAEITQLATVNGADATVWNPINANRGVHVNARTTFDTFFMGIFNIDTLTVGATSRATYAPGNSMDEILPLAATCDCVAFDREVTLETKMSPAYLVVIDEDGVDNGISTIEALAADHGVAADWLVNDNNPSKTGNPPLPWNNFYPGDVVVLPGGQVGDEGWFILPATIDYADDRTTELSDAEWLDAFYDGTLPQEQLDKVRDVQPMHNSELAAMVGLTFVGIVYDSDVSINYSPLNANLQGERYGAFSFTVLAVIPGGGDGGLDDLEVRVEAPLTYEQRFAVGVGAGNAAGACYFDWLDWNGGGSSNAELAAAIADLGESGAWAVGDTVEIGPGVANITQVKQELDGWLDRPATVVLYEEADRESDRLICGFAQFTLAEYDFTQAPQWVRGEFSRVVRRTVTTRADGPDFGVRDVRLAQ